MRKHFIHELIIIGAAHCVAFGVLGAERRIQPELRPATEDEFRTFFGTVLKEPPISSDVFVLVTSTGNLGFKEVERRVRARDSAVFPGVDRDAHAGFVRPRVGPSQTNNPTPVPVAFLERALTVPEGWRIDQQVFRHGAEYIAHSPELIQRLRTNVFEPQWSRVVDESQEERRSHQRNWKVGSSHYDLRQKAGPPKPDNHHFGMANIGIRVVAIALVGKSKTGMIGKDLIDVCVAGRGVVKLEHGGNLTLRDGLEVGEFVVSLKINASFRVVARVLLTEAAPYAVLRSVVYNPVTGLVVRYDIADRDRDSREPRRWDVYEEGVTGRWEHKTRSYLRFTLSPEYDYQAEFAYDPPFNYSIENHTSGKTVIERYPMVGGRRLGPQNVAWADHVARPEELSRTSWARAFLWATITLPLVAALLFKLWQRLGRSHKNETKQKTAS